MFPAKAFCSWTLALVLIGVPCQAQDSQTASTATEAPEVRGSLAPDLSAGLWVQPAQDLTTVLWVELTPFGQNSHQLEIEPGWAEPAGFPWHSGRAMLCWGGASQATSCQQLRGRPGQMVELALTPGVDLVGRFLEGDRPISGSLRLAPGDLNEPVAFTMPLLMKAGKLHRELDIGSDGKFRVPRLAAGTYLLEAQLSTGRVFRRHEIEIPSRAELLRGREGDLELAAVFDLGELFIDPGVEVEFFVTDASGLPLPEATVALSQGSDRSERQVFRATTDEAGRGRVSGIDLSSPGETICQAAGHAEVRVPYEQPPAVVDCALERLARVAVWVVDEAGDAMPGAVVALKVPARMGSRLILRTAEDGKASFENLPAGHYAMSVSAPGRAAQRTDLNLAPGEEHELKDFVLLPGYEFDGLVVEAESGEPVEGAELEILDPPGSGGARTDEQGRFALSTGDELLEIRVQAPGYATRTLEIYPLEVQNSEEPVQIALSRGGQILVEVIDEVSGLPCVDCRVNISGVGTLRTDAAGQALWKSLHPGRYTVGRPQVRSLGTLVTVRGGHRVKFADVESGRVTLVRFGKRHMNLEVTVRPSLPAGWSLMVRSGQHIDIYQRQSIDTFRIRYFPEAASELTLTRDDRGGQSVVLGTIPADFDQRRIELPLWNTRVSGQLVDKDDVLAGRLVELQAFDQTAVHAWAHTDERGGFELPFVAPGVYALSLEGRMVRVVQVNPGAAVRLGTVDIGSGSL